MKSIGIIGGMGPLATADLFQKIIRMTDAENDREHIHIYIDNNTAIPDRTEAIVRGGEDPCPELIRSAVKLESMGADLLIMPCNTAHFFYEEVRRHVRIPFLNMIEEAVGEACQRGIKTVGLLATDGTMQSVVYARCLEEHGIQALCPDEAGQRHVMDLIYEGVKAGREDWDMTAFLGVLEELQARGAGAFVLGCTELPVAFEKYAIQKPFIDPTLALAKSAVLCAGYRVRE